MLKTNRILFAAALAVALNLVLAPLAMAQDVSEMDLEKQRLMKMKWAEERAAAKAEWMAEMTKDASAPPGNDQCDDAFGDLAVGTVTTGSSLDATGDSPPAPSPCGVDDFGPIEVSEGVWYTVEGTGNTMTASTCSVLGGGADFDTQLCVYCDDCPDLITVAGDDDDTDNNCGNFLTSTVSWPSEAGAEYRILVHGFFGATGDFDLAILDDGTPATPTVSCPVDSDGDGVPDDEDNCPDDANPNQEDFDEDGHGDACDVCPFDPDDDADGDGLCGDVDLCPDTVIPESVPTVRLGVNRFALTDGDGIFDTTSPPGGGNGPGLTFTIEDTAGCSCEQIIDELGLGNGHRKFGCSISAMEDWVAMVNP